MLWCIVGSKVDGCKILVLKLVIFEVLLKFILGIGVVFGVICGLVL